MSTRPVRASSRLVLYAASAVVVAVVVAACTSGTRSERATGPEPVAATSAAPPAAGTSPVEVPADPGDAALLLQSLLGQHAVLAADMMRGRLRDDPDLAQAANAALGRNTDAIGQIVAALFGDPARQQFTTLWGGHVQALFNYSRGVADGDDSVRAAARVQVAKLERDLSAFFSAASQGRLPQQTAQGAVTMHIDHLLQQTDAYEAGQYAQANEIYREGFRHAFGLGQALAATLLPPAAAPALATPMWRLRSELNRLLGEHVVLVVSTMRAAATESPDFTAAAATVNANTQDLAAAIDTLFGPAARVLDSFEARLADFLGAATKQKLAASSVAKAVRAHDRMLLDQVNAYVGKDYQRANDIGYSTYQEMYGLARQMA